MSARTQHLHLRVSISPTAPSARSNVNSCYLGNMHVSSAATNRKHKRQNANHVRVSRARVAQMFAHIAPHALVAAREGWGQHKERALRRRLRVETMSHIVIIGLLIYSKNVCITLLHLLMFSKI